MEYIKERVIGVALTPVGWDYWFWQQLALRKAKSLSPNHRGKSGTSKTNNIRDCLSDY